MLKPNAEKVLAAAGIRTKDGRVKKSDMALAITVLAERAEDWFGRYKNLHSSVAARIEEAPKSAQYKFAHFDDPFKDGFDPLIDYEEEFKCLKALADALG